MESKVLLILSLIVVSVSSSAFLIHERTQLINELEYQNIVIADTQNSIQELSDDLSKVQDSLTRKERDYDTMTQIYQGRISSLNEQIEQLSIQNTLWEDNYETLEENNRLYYLIHIATNLDSFYDLVREEKGLTGINVIVGGLDQAQPTQISFASKLALHDLGFSCFPRMEEDYYEATGNSSYIMAHETLKQIIEELDISETDTDTQKIAKILELVNDEVYYKPEPTDIYKAPTETLRIGSGDCDDYSILAAALFEMVGVNSALGLFDNAEGEWHMMVLVNIEELEGYHYTHWHDLTNMGLDKGYWTIIEPQRRINNQVDGLDMWNIHYAKQIG